MDIIGIGSGPTTNPDTGDDVYQLICPASTDVAEHSTEDRGTVSGPPGFTPNQNFQKCDTHHKLDILCGTTPSTFAQAIALRCAQFTTRSNVLILNGFNFIPPSAPDGTLPVVMSMSDNAQRDYLGLQVNAQYVPFPMSIPGLIDGNYVTLSNLTDLQALCGSALGLRLQHNNEAAALCTQVIACTDIDALLSIEDTR